MKRFLTCAFTAFLVLSATPSVGAAPRWGSPHMTLSVVSGSRGPAQELEVHVPGDDRVVFEFQAVAKWWGDRRVVFHADRGTDPFGATYYLRRRDGWRNITPTITSDGGASTREIRYSADLVVRLVIDVDVTAPHRYGETHRHRFSVVAGAPNGKEHVATAIVRAGW